MKHLTITVGNHLTLFDGDVDEIVFTDSDSGVAVQGKMRRPSSGGGNALMQLLAGATKQPPALTQEDSTDG